MGILQLGGDDLVASLGQKTGIHRSGAALDTFLVVVLVAFAVIIPIAGVYIGLTLYISRAENRSERTFVPLYRPRPEGELPMLDTDPDGPRDESLPPPFLRPHAFAVEYPKLHREMPDEFGPPTRSWNETTPWKPGDPATMPTRYATKAPGASRVPEPIDRGDGRGLDHLLAETEPAPQSYTPPSRSRQNSNTRTSSGKPGFQWSEDSRKYQGGEPVRSTRNISNDLGILTKIPDDTKGRVLAARIDHYGNEKVTVAFDNDYTGEVDARTIERRSIFD
ncbi:hypothetical protein [Amycolatopsis lurida]|uniref:hypothetical protein n=1 Tax=Amycolatopsis lurida TaxID=31959 RepID=UPI00364D7B8A